MSIRPHPSHTVWYVVDHYPNGRNGKREREPSPTYGTGRTVSDALKKHKASPAGTTHPRIEQISEEFLRWMKENPRPDTDDNRQQCLTHMLPTFRNYRIKDLTLSILRSYMSWKSRHIRYGNIYAVNQFLRHKSLGTTATYLRKYAANMLQISCEPAPILSLTT
ncbi:MAG: hypothetical protein J0665_00785 [Deltaproteobacteria bacterium]|jgi:hypothetical protein|nr:hypothetical protein [Deltaproteobacteria bacterium]